MNMSPSNKAHFEAEKEAIHLILTGIGDEIYSMLMLVKQLRKSGKLLKGYNKVNPSIFNITHTTTRYKGKEIAKPITHPSETTFKEDNDPKQAQMDKDMQKNLALIAKENVGSPVLQQSGIQCFNCKEFRHFEDTDKEIDKKELEAHYSYMENIQEVPTADTGTNSEPLEQVQNDTGYNVFANDLQHSEQSKFISNTCLVELDDSNVIPDSPDKCDDDIQNDQNDVENDDERVALANLIANLKINVDENKKIQNQLKKANTTLAQEMKECKTILAKTSKTLGESNSIRDSFLVALQNKQTEFEKYKTFNDHTVEYHKLERKLNETLGKLALKDIEIKEEKHSISLEIALQKCKEQKLIEKGKGKSVETKFDKPYVVRQPNAQRIPKPSVLGVNHKTNVSRPQHMSNQLKDKVMPNNSQVKPKKTQVEEHPRISSISNKTKSVTACNDSLNSRTLNVNDVCATYGKCLVDSNHFACVTKMLNDVNSRTKKPNVVPISTRKPKGHTNKSFATPHKKKVTSQPTNQKTQSYYRMLYEKTSKTWKWWIEQQSPSGYKWVPKTKMQWVPKSKNESMQKRVSFAIDNASRITDVLKRTNSLGSNLSSVPSSSNSLEEYFGKSLRILACAASIFSSLLFLRIDDYSMNTAPVNRQIHSKNLLDRKSKRVRDSAYHKEKMLLCKQAE
nr:hypothetical protein [Tanacetum cinerariifolium]